MVSYPIDFPSAITVSSLRITPRNAVSRNMSKFSFVEQVYDFGGEMWSVEGTLPLMNRDTAESYMSFVFKLKGRFGTFLFPLPTSISQARGAWGGTPQVDGGGQTGDTLDVKGLPNSVTGVVKAGDYINLGSGANTKLHKVLDDADSNGSGEATLNIWPSLRVSPNDSDSVIYQNVKLLCRMTDDIPIDIDVNKYYFIAFNALEALDGS
jgi:hypothetical protein